MAATHSEYRGYLRNSVDMEAGQHRFHPVQHSEPTCRPLLFGTLAVMGLLQVASSVAILLHLTGYLQEEAQTEPVLNALRDTRKNNKRCRTSKESLPSAHLPIRTHQENSKRGEPKPITIDWDVEHGYCYKMSYQRGKLMVIESGLYYIYAKTCFRYYKDIQEDSSHTGVPPVDVSNTQLIQYIYHESIKQNSKAAVLMKTGSTMRLNITSYNMYCAQQGRGLQLDGGDTLYVNVSNAWLLDPDGEGTYFGAMKLGN